jgi:hypothetical protein
MDGSSAQACTDLLAQGLAFLHHLFAAWWSQPTIYSSLDTACICMSHQLIQFLFAHARVKDLSATATV